MTSTHVTNGAGTPETVTKEPMVTPPKRDRRLYMREYRRRVADNNPSPEIKDQIEPEVEIVNSEIKPEPEAIKSESITAEQKPTAEYQQKEIPQDDATTKALKARIAEIEAASELNRQRQAAYAEQLAQQQRAAQAQQAALPPTREERLELWRSQGLINEAEDKLLRENPAMIDHPDLAGGCAAEAIRRGYARGSPGFVSETKQLFNQALPYYKHALSGGQTMPLVNEEPFAEARNAQAAQPPTRPQATPGRSGIVSAPVSRELPGHSDFENDPRSVCLSADQVEAARVSGISPAEYARQLIRMQRMRANGEIEP